MNKEIKLKNSGAFPTYLNLASPNIKYQIYDDRSVRYVDFSSCHTTYIVKQEPIPIKQQYVTYR